MPMDGPVRGPASMMGMGRRPGRGENGPDTGPDMVEKPTYAALMMRRIHSAPSRACQGRNRQEGHRCTESGGPENAPHPKRHGRGLSL
ncbi:hypothetical protein GMO_14750 [Gluconobacter morbifer G707]|uniref:Uncharacterized protein n=1 Tax=Gluconobacter morbifer G707 TaxID=1088869 RepID=G6XJ09_9PROT|nr:hypothetical protein GMO_14750 [Gluconobacter morbifer G707]